MICRSAPPSRSDIADKVERVLVEEALVVDIADVTRIGHYHQRGVLSVMQHSILYLGQKHLVILAHKVERRYRYIFVEELLDAGVELVAYPHPVEETVERESLCTLQIELLRFLVLLLRKHILGDNALEEAIGYDSPESGDELEQHSSLGAEVCHRTRKHHTCHLARVVLGYHSHYDRAEREPYEVTFLDLEVIDNLHNLLGSLGEAKALAKGDLC